MDIISYNEAATANSRIEKFNTNPDSNSGVLTQPRVIEAGETVTIKSGRQAILANILIEGDLVVEDGGEVFVPAGAPSGSDSVSVKLTGNQIIDDVKTFTSSPIVPTPTANFQVATKKYVDDIASAELLRIEDIESDITKKADLDPSGKIPASQLPDIASGRKIKVNSEADRLTVSIYPDLTIAYQMDDGSSWVINGNEDPSDINNWAKLGSALISQVSSFNGRTGNVSPETGDYASDMITETTEKQFVSNDEKISWNNRLADADKNGKLYGRKNGGWAEIVSSDGGTNVEIVAITNKLDAKGIEANKVLVSNGDDTSEWKDYNTYSYTESGIAPLNPKLGDDWRDTANGKLYKWSNVGGAAQWSEIGAGSSSGGFNPDDDIILSTGKGVVMTSGDGTMYKLYIDNDGRLTTEVV